MSQAAEEMPRPLEQYRDYLRLLARVRLKPGAGQLMDPSDIAQQTLVKAHQNLKGFRGTTEAELRAWLRAILAQQLASYARKNGRGRRRTQSLETAIEEPWTRLESRLTSEHLTPSQHVIKAERSSELSRALLTLPDDQRTALELKYLKGMSVADVARRMGRSTMSVTGLLFRGTKALRQVMREPE